ncbi:MAG: nitrous oxide reductase accessory protein NosL [Cyclobacteriaceae bacterium]|nr:nitrous oxide reductase accessory protein NosL [Cyclobacteriaceae bacterium]
MKKAVIDLIVNKIMVLVLLTGMLACTPTPQPIAYGQQACDFCRMGIMDQRYAAELVTQKGKIFTFDAVECMVNYYQKQEQEKFAHVLVNSYDKPGELLDAFATYYLISEDLPSPMGMFLTAISDEEMAEKMVKKHGGEVYQWQGLMDLFDSQRAMHNHQVQHAAH